MPPPNRSPSPEPPGPQPIRRLQESLINRIAAGEIIHRPASALKELVENCLDARATSIKVTVKDGGMKLLQIQDNGSGIRKADLPILAERFTTSKLSTFSDLSSLTTYGFRGEALASISHVAHLSVVTKTKDESCAWKACYLDGALTPAKPGLTPDPKPCAGNDGTTITAEDLFYNTPTRLSALRSSSEEYARILDVVTRYAAHNPTVSFTCKKAGSASPDLSTPSNSTTKEAIRLLYGTTIAKELLSISVSDKKNAARQAPDKESSEGTNESVEVDDEHDDKISGGRDEWKAQVYFTGANYHAKKMVLLLFINHRLVESTRIKRALENVYNTILPKGTSPFVYLSLEIDPRAVDVNVHPTKREVHFLHEDDITERISDAVQIALISNSRSRVFERQTQTVLMNGAVVDPSTATTKGGKGKERRVEDLIDDDGESSSAISSTKQQGTQEPKKMQSKNKVRTSLKDRTLDSMFPVVDLTQTTASNNTLTESDPPNATAGAPVKLRDIAESECILTSVHNLRQIVSKTRHNLLTEILEKHIFVGIVDINRSLSLIQHSTKLYLVNHAALAEELFYQLGLRQFGNFHRLKLEPPPPIRTLVRLAVQAEESLKVSGLGLNEEQVVDRIVDKVVMRAAMLDEYFSMRINAQGELESLPLLLRDYTPNLDKLPLFLMRLGPQVDWNTELNCFSSFLRELAYFYTPGPLLDSENEAVSSPDNAKQGDGDKAERWQIQHVIFPCLRRYLVAPKSLLDRDVVQVASLPDLYRVFERC